MAKAMSQDATLYRVCIRKVRGQNVSYDYYGPYTTPAPGKAMVSRLRRVMVRDDNVPYSSKFKPMYDDVSVYKVEKVSRWEEVYE